MTADACLFLTVNIISNPHSSVNCASNNHKGILNFAFLFTAISTISELVIANENQPRSCITILAEKDKVEMEDEIRSHVDSTGRTRIVCRTGNPTDLADLDIVNPNDARSIIILASEEYADPDSSVIKTIGRDETELVLIGDLISRITVQTFLRNRRGAPAPDLVCIRPPRWGC